MTGYFLYSMTKTRRMVLFLKKNKKERRKLLENFMSILGKGTSILCNFLEMGKKLIFSYIPTNNVTDYVTILLMHEEIYFQEFLIKKCSLNFLLV